MAVIAGTEHTVWLQRCGHTFSAECWSCKEVGTLCGQNAEVAKRWAHCGQNAEVAKRWAHFVGKMLKLSKYGYTVWPGCWICKEVGTLCGQNAEVSKMWAHCMARMLKLQRGGHTLWAECWSCKEVGTLCGQNAEVAKRWAHCVARMLKLKCFPHLYWWLWFAALLHHVVWQLNARVSEDHNTPSSRFLWNVYSHHVPD
jgi:hypothetical protein